jgi:hypothetical protein
VVAAHQIGFVWLVLLKPADEAMTRTRDFAWPKNTTELARMGLALGLDKSESSIRGQDNGILFKAAQKDFLIPLTSDIQIVLKNVPCFGTHLSGQSHWPWAVRVAGPISSTLTEKLMETR